MKQRPIMRSDFATAMTLLSEGFPAQSPEMWGDCLTRLFAHAEHDWDGSIGSVASVGGADIGMCLAIPSIRTAYEPVSRPVRNLACFYLRPGHEWRTTPFMRRIMADQSIEYTDLTASASMRQILRKLGFRDSADGLTIVPTPVAALLPSRDAKILPMACVAPGQLLDHHRRLLEDHARLHAMAFAIELAGHAYPIILTLTRYRRLPGARVVLARDRDLLRMAAGPLARYLLRKGIAFLAIDSPSHMAIPGSQFVTGIAPVQTTRMSETGAIDHTYSELVFVPPSRGRTVMRWRPSLRPRRAIFAGFFDTTMSGATAAAILGLADAMTV